LLKFNFQEGDTALHLALKETQKDFSTVIQKLIDHPKLDSSIQNYV
jgi:hypothetical protein